MARNVALLGFPNYGAQSYGVITTPATAASLVPAGFEPAFLKTEEPADTARISTLNPLYTQWVLNLGKSGKAIDGVSLVNAKLSPWGRYRYFKGSLSLVDTAPDGLVAGSVNTTGVVGNVDEVINSPDTSYLSPTTTSSAWSFALDFATPASAPIFSSEKCMFVLRVLLVGTPSTLYPKINVTLYAGGVAITDLGWRAVTVSTGSGQVLIFPFTLTSGLFAANGSDIRIFVEGQPGDGGSYFKVEAVRLYTESTTPSSDSGWLASPVGDYSSEDTAPPTVSLPYFPSSQWTSVDQLQVWIADDQTDHSPDMGSSVTGVPINNVSQRPDDYIEAGVLCAGAAIGGTSFLSKGIPNDEPPALHVIVEEEGGQTVGGQTYGADSWRRRGMSLQLFGTRDELLTIMNRLVWRRGHSGAFFVAVEPDISVSRQLFSACWVTVKEAGEMTRYRNAKHDAGAGTMLCTIHLELEEKL